jgi:hypothetical protein
MLQIVRNVSVIGLLLGASFTASAADSPAKVDGILMDKMCSASAAKDAGFAAKHDVKCALESACMKSGYGVYTTDGKFLTFDAAGNAKAVVALKATKKVDNLKVSVMGDVTGSTIKVASVMLQ